MQSSEQAQISESGARPKLSEDRLPTGIEEFDRLIEGGFPRGDMVLLVGDPGSGKTIFGSQFLYHGISKLDEPGIYVSFAENHEAFLRNMKKINLYFKKYEEEGTFRFMDFVTAKEESVGDSLARVLAHATSLNAKRVVIDSFSALAQGFSEKIDARIVLHTILGKIARMRKVTVLLICEKPFGSESLGGGMEEFVADGVVLLRCSTEKGWLERTLQVLKMRGTQVKGLQHSFNIDDHGIRVWPAPEIKTVEKVFTERVMTGIKGLDIMLNGGVFKGSLTLVAGAAGTGKTTSAMHFIVEGGNQNERSLYISSEEPAEQLIKVGEGFGWHPRELIDKKAIKVASFNIESFNAEYNLLQVRSLLKEFKPTRFVIDTLTPLERAISEDTYMRQLKSLGSYLKAEGVTTLFTAISEPIAFTTHTGISTLVDNIMFLRHVEIESALKRALVIMKARGTAHDSDIREFEITPKGIVVKEKFAGMEQLMLGAPRKSLTDNLARAWTKSFAGKQ